VYEGSPLQVSALTKQVTYQYRFVVSQRDVGRLSFPAWGLCCRLCLAEIPANEVNLCNAWPLMATLYTIRSMSNQLDCTGNGVNPRSPTKAKHCRVQCCNVDDDEAREASLRILLNGNKTVFCVYFGLDFLGPLNGV
jgi:hypothetical protein